VITRLSATTGSKRCICCTPGRVAGRRPSKIDQRASQLPQAAKTVNYATVKGLSARTNANCTARLVQECNSPFDALRPFTRSCPAADWKKRKEATRARTGDTRSGSAGPLQEPVEQTDT